MTNIISINMNIIRDIIESLLNILFELKNARKTNTSFRCKAVIFFPNGTGNTYNALTNEGEQFLLIPQLLRCHMGLPRINFKYVDGIKTCYLSSNYHGTLDMDRLCNIADSIKYQAILKMHYARNWYKLEIKNISASIDTSLWDNDFSSDFCHHSHRIITTKALSIVDEVSKRVFLVSCILCLFIGIVMGYIGSSIVDIVLAIIVKSL